MLIRKKFKKNARRVMLVCLALVMFWGSAFAFEPAVALSERQHSAAELSIDDLWIDDAEFVDLMHWQEEDNELTELPPEILEALLREQEAYFAIPFREREKAAFITLLNDKLNYSVLTEEERSFIFRQLDIAYEAQGVTNLLFEQMQRDGFTLAESIELVRIMSSGLFDYVEAQLILQTIPNTLERLMAVAYFEKYAVRFDILNEISTRGLTNLLAEERDVERLNISELLNAGRDSLQVQYEYKYIEVPQLETERQPPTFEEPPPYMEEYAPVKIEYYSTSEEQYLTRYSYDEQYILMAYEYIGRRECALYLGHSNIYSEENYSMPEGYKSYYEEPPYIFENEQATTLERVRVESALGDLNDFELARQLFLNNHRIAELEEIMSQSDVRRDIAHQISVRYTSHEILAKVLFADVVSDDELDSAIDFDIFNYSPLVQIMPMSTITHEDIVQSPFALRFNINESVSLNTGASMYRVNILSLPGRNGFNVNLSMVYDSSRAYLQASNNTFTTKRNLHGLGEGWIFDLPSIWNNVLYIPGRGSFALNGNQILDYTLHDMRLFNDTTFVSGALRSNRRLTFLNGTSYFFNGANIIGMVDRFGNTIRFEYTNTQWQVNNQRLLSRIIDTNDKVITFTHGFSTDNQTITITDPGEGVFVINISRTLHNSVAVFLLNNVQNQVDVVTSFTYTNRTVNYHLSNKNPTAAGTRTNTSWLLSRITYQAGAELRFEYGQHSKNVGQNGSRHVFRVTSRLLHYNGREYLRTTFGYEGDATAFPQHVIRPPTNHTYRTTVTQNNGLRTVYTFNHRHLNISQKVYNAEGTLLSERAIGYNNDRLPTSIEVTEYRGTLSSSTRQQFTYNRYGQVIQFVSPLAQGSALAQYRVDYTFDARFGLPLTRTTRPNASTTVIEKNTILNYGGQSTGERVYENNVRQARTTFSHDLFGNIFQIHEFFGDNFPDIKITTISYYSGTKPSQIFKAGIRNADGNQVPWIVCNFTYDAMWRTLSETDPNGYTTSFEYDRLGRITRITLPNGGYIAYQYNDQQNTLTHRTILGAVYTYQYDGLGNLVSITVDGVEILRNIFDNRMRIIETRNAQGIASSQRTTFNYDIFDRVIERRSLNSSGEILHRETIEFADVFDVAGNRRITATVVGTGINSGIAPNIQTFIQYDRFGRRTQEGIVGGGVITYTHDLAGRVVTERSLGVSNTFTHNVHGVTAVRNILGYTAYINHDMLGRVVSSTDFMGNTQRFTYDGVSRLISQRTPFERIGDVVHYAEVRYFYDSCGNLIRTANLINTPGQAEVWARTENTFRYNRLMSSQTGGVHGLRTVYTYDRVGNVLTKTVGGATTTFTYNNRGQLISIKDALGQTETFEYDANGQLISHIDRNGTHFYLFYDNLGRMFRKEARQNGIVTDFRNYSFHSTGALRQVTNGAHTITYCYDSQGRLIRQTETGGIVKTFAYNTANNLTQSRVYVNGVLESHNQYTYDAAQRLETVTVNGELIATYTYNANGNRISRVSPNGLRTDYTHNLAGLVTNMTNRHGSVLLSSFDYLFYLDGNTRQVTENLNGSVRIKTYTYDLARRLVREQTIGANARTESFTFDNRGNRITRSVTGEENYTVAYTYDLNNRLLTKAKTPAGGSAEITTFTYDRNGNQLISTTGERVETKTYNAFNQLVEVNIYGGEEIERFNVAFDNNGGTGTLPNITGRLRGDVITTPFSNMTRPGYFQNGWLLDCPKHGAFVVSGGTFILQYDATLYARWIPNIVILQGDVDEMSPIANHELEDISEKFTAAFSAAGGTGILPPSTTNNHRGDIVVAPFANLTKPGYVKVGWLLDCPMHGAFVAPGGTFILQYDATLYARWIPNIIILQGDVDEMSPIVNLGLDEILYFLSQVEILQNAHICEETYEVSATSNEFNQLTNISASSILVTYIYRADGLRHSKTVNEATTTHTWFGGSIILERDGRGVVVNRFARSLTGRLIRSEQHGYYLHNARGDVVQRVNAQGELIRNYRYTAFGVELNPDENNRNPFRFAGEYWDAETGTYYLRARNFNPRTGRFTQPDPHWNIGNMQSSTAAILQSSNLFVYCINNPIMWNDPSGRFIIPGVGGAILGGIIIGGIVGGAVVGGSGGGGGGSGSTAGGGGLIASAGGFMFFGMAFTGSSSVTGGRTDPIMQNIVFASGSTPEQKAAFNMAINYLREGSTTARELIEIIENGGERITIIFNNSRVSTYLMYGRTYGRTIHWDPTAGLDVLQGFRRGSISPGTMSAAMVLAHELGHAAQHLDGALIRDPTRSELIEIENANIERWERPIAQELGEPWRNVYQQGVGMRRMRNPTNFAHIQGTVFRTRVYHNQ